MRWAGPGGGSGAGEEWMDFKRRVQSWNSRARCGAGRGREAKGRLEADLRLTNRVGDDSVV